MRLPACVLMCHYLLNLPCLSIYLHYYNAIAQSILFGAIYQSIGKKRIGKGEANFQVKKEHVEFKASTKRSKDVVHDLLIQQCWSF